MRKGKFSDDYVNNVVLRNHKLVPIDYEPLDIVAKKKMKGKRYKYNQLSNEEIARSLLPIDAKIKKIETDMKTMNIKDVRYSRMEKDLERMRTERDEYAGRLKITELSSYSKVNDLTAKIQQLNYELNEESLEHKIDQRKQVELELLKKELLEEQKVRETLYSETKGSLIKVYSEIYVKLDKETKKVFPTPYLLKKGEYDKTAVIDVLSVLIPLEDVKDEIANASSASAVDEQVETLEESVVDDEEPAPAPRPRRDITEQEPAPRPRRDITEVDEEN
jgi:outer membrane murein-binding lipoprotein Lpp